MTRKVGYGSTPEHTRFQKGQSGNPKGRPKGKANLATDLAAELSETILISEGGKPKTITKQRALLKALMTKGIKGDVRAAQLLMHWAVATIDAPSDGVALQSLDSNDLKILQSYLARQAPLKEEK